MNTKNKGEIAIYQSENGKQELIVKLENETVWLTQKQMSVLFKKGIPTINEHISNACREGEIERNSTIRKYRIVQQEGSRSITRDVDFYNLDVVISVGYRVKSKEGTRFRIWATKVLRDHIIHGITINTSRLKDIAATENLRLKKLEDGHDNNSSRIMALNMTLNKFLLSMAHRTVLNAVIDDVEVIKLKVADIEVLKTNVKEILSVLEGMERKKTT